MRTHGGDCMIRQCHLGALFAFMAVMAAIGVNALLFAFKGANPLVASDAWYFVDHMLLQIPAGTFGIEDLFAKRSGFDHSQPLKKLILLFHYYFFDLDFTIEAVVSVMVAFINIAMLWRISRNGVIAGIAEDKRFLLVFAALSAVYLSLNASMIFSWTLVTMTYTTHAFIIMFMASAWHAMRDGRHGTLALFFFVSLLLNMVGDIMGVVSTIAILVPVALVSSRQGPWRRGVMVAATAVAACVVYKAAFMLLVAPPAIAAKTGIVESVRQLLPQIDQAWQWLVIPLSGSVVHAGQLRAWLGPGNTMLQVLVAIVLVLCHGWFWWQAWKGRQNQASFVSIGLMLLFYGLVAAVLVGRVSTQGAGYLMQLRYTAVYQWNIVALLLMVLAQYAHRAPEGSVAVGDAARSMWRMSAVVPVAASLLLLLQIPLSVNTWGGLRYTSDFHQKMAIQMVQLAEDPATVPHACVPILSVCDLAPARRAEIMQFLEHNRLNLFSPDFRARHHLYLDVDPVPPPKP